MNITQVISTQRREELVAQALNNAMSSNEYLELFEKHVQSNSSTYPDASESMAQYTKLNWARAKRVGKTLKIPQEIKENFSAYNADHSWLVITESWCGDAAQSIPVMQRLLELSDDAQIKIVLRDQHPQLMDAFLFDGTRSIPVLIVVDNTSGQIVGSWGPRPGVINEQVREYKKQHGGLTAEFKKDLQRWYNKDKGLTTMQDLSELIA
ncbi:thioredoxin family protein [Aureitalea marina]|uniref:Thioredoxin family protein n=1 Tax=Aureitalea marina TaxID=930804 RepID=A0A2S7KTG4_9FLAO|nr:thioredoxin family protein [Aureitalea marina]PQB05813.1 hypothetical protein BST85_13590 [Aureitalea marina]